MKTLLVYLTCLFLTTTPLQADEFADKVEKVLELSNTVEPAIEIVDDMLESLASQTIDQMFQGFKDQGKDVTRDDVVELYSEYRKQFVAAFGENLIEMMVEPYRQSFSSEDLDELIELMETPTFKKYAMKTPELTAAGAKAGELFGVQMAQEILLKLIAENPKFQ